MKIIEFSSKVYGFHENWLKIQLSILMVPHQHRSVQIRIDLLEKFVTAVHTEFLVRNPLSVLVQVQSGELYDGRWRPGHVRYRCTRHLQKSNLWSQADRPRPSREGWDDACYRRRGRWSGRKCCGVGHKHIRVSVQQQVSKGKWSKKLTRWPGLGHFRRRWCRFECFRWLLCLFKTFTDLHVASASNISKISKSLSGYGFVRAGLLSSHNHAISNCWSRSCKTYYRKLDFGCALYTCWRTSPSVSVVKCVPFNFTRLWQDARNLID